MRWLMRRQLFISTLAAGLSLLLTAAAWPAAGDKPLLVIDEVPYTAGDFRQWWQHWQEEGMEFPASPDPYLEWLLLSREAASMELDQDAAVARKLEVFLKARSLVMLKNEAIDSRISISESELRARYDKQYSPRNLVQVLYFNSGQTADQAFQELKSGRLDIEAFKAQARQHGSDVYYQEQLLRPVKTSPEWQPVISGLEVGGIAAPVQWSKGYVILRLQQRTGFDEQDFNALRETISRALRKEHEAELTAALVEDLMKKYQVEINRQPLAGLDFFGPPLESYSEEAVITTARGSVSVRQFVEMLRGHVTAARPETKDAAQIEKLRERVLGDIVSQSLTSWAALDRHYEEQPPLKEAYEFYRRHRMIKELERRFFAARTQPGEEEISRYYQQHQDEFALPATVTIACLEYTGEQVDRLWAEVLTGADFSATGIKYSGHEPFSREVETGRLEAAEKEAVAKLALGEVSQPFSKDGHWELIKLLQRRPAGIKPLAEVSAGIAGKLSQEKFTENKNNYLARLRSRVSIAVNDEVWAALRTELAAKQEK